LLRLARRRGGNPTPFSGRGYLEGAEHVVRYLREQQQIDRLLID